MIANNLRRYAARLGWLLGILALATLNPLAAQVPTQAPPGLPLPGGQVPSPAVAEQLLKSRPDLVQQLRQRIGASGLTREQIRARLRAAGYPENFLDPYLAGADSTQIGQAKPGSDIVDAVRTLGIVGNDEVDSLLVLTDSAQRIADSLRADSLSDTAAVLRVFGTSVFRRSSSLFNPALAGPVDPNYKLGPGDALVLILTGDVEAAHDLVVTREGFIAIPQVGQLNVANLTLAQLEDLLYARLSRVYSGVRRGSGATTHFTVTVSKLRTVQIFVAGDVAR
ncbi:MAG TPA: polysaccharide biosynthesis/export family protein, partial [Gemmatimonadales bacterium]|nr:polysaccharide biosynthesis/export family protein [Gemmatimonadales bacterium]